jgi:hypothetical protein
VIKGAMIRPPAGKGHPGPYSTPAR